MTKTARNFLLVVIVAWGVRLLFLLRMEDSGNLYSLLYHGDTRAYLRFAVALLQGVPYDSGIPYHPPGYPFLLSGLLRLFGYAPGSPPPALALKAFMALTGGVTCGLFYLLGTRIAGARVALAALPLCLFSFGHYVQATAINSESFFLLLELTVVVGLVWLVRTTRGAKARALAAAALGLVAGWAALSRTEFLLTAGLLALVLVWVGRRRTIVPAAIFALFFLLALTPWTVRCFRSIGEVNRVNTDTLPRPLPQLIIVTGYGPFNFAVANNSLASGSFDTRLVERLVPGREGRGLDLADPQINRLYLDGYRIGLGWMAQNPGEAARLIGRKLALASHSLALGYTQGNVPSGLEGERRPVDQFVSRARWLLWVHLVLCGLGLWRLLRHGKADGETSRRLLLFLAPIAVTTLAVVVAFFGYVRVGMLLAPVTWTLAGAGLLAVAERIPWPATVRRRPGTWVAGLIAAVLLIELLGTLTGPYDFGVRGTKLPGSSRINPDELVEIKAR